MTVAFPFYQGDVAPLRELLLWIGQLGGARNHHALLVADAGTQWSDCVSILEFASPIFRKVDLTATEQSTLGWPAGPNALFRHAAEHMAKVGKPFLWLEPDAIPVKQNWLDLIDIAYMQCGKPFMGRYYKNETAGLPSIMLTGIGVYPHDVLLRWPQPFNAEAFDVSMSRTLLNQSANTELIWAFWGQPKLPPTFVKVKAHDSPINAFTLDKIPPEAAVMHRNKDGTLIKLLRERMFPNMRAGPFTVVMSFFNGDADVALKTLRWIEALGTPRTHPIVLLYQQGTDQAFLAPILHQAGKSFTQVHRAVYPKPARGIHPANVGFVNAAIAMQQMDRPWLWMEPDTIPLKRSWLHELQTEYDRCGKNFCGPVVPHRGHMNGTGIYPPNTPDLIPKAMRARDKPWDWLMREEMIHDCHDCSRIFFHVWGEVNGVLNPVEGDAPNFRNRELLKQIPHQAVILHRCKDGSLIDELSKTL